MVKIVTATEVKNVLSNGVPAEAVIPLVRALLNYIGC